MILRLFLSLCISITCLQIQAQSAEYWQRVDEDDIAIDGQRVIVPEKFQAFELDVAQLQEVLATAPLEGTPDALQSEVLLSIPLPDGTITDFRIVRYTLMEADIQAQYPKLRAYYGRGVDDPSQRIRLDWTSVGFRAMLSMANATVFIDPYAKGNNSYYVSYYKRDYPSPVHSFHCGVKDGFDEKLNIDLDASTKAGDCQFRTYRIAIACTAEYCNFHGATSAAQSDLVLSEVMTSVNRLNDVYEIDMTIRFILVNNADAVFYYNAGSDPYTNGDPGEMIGEVGPDLNMNIGAANYDIGHVYGTNSGGLAGLRVVCGNGKARGVTGSGSPTNDPFWIDYVAHEVGHQFGGNHTQNNNCNRSSASFEPGSASTIMGYAGICDPDVQGNSDPYFHAISQAEVSSFVVNGNGNGCATIIANPNNAPTVDAGSDYTIPISTPYVLTATGTDTDPADVLTYCWEQYNNEIGEAMPPVPTNLQGPMFRSLLPTTSNQRYFPKLATVVANGTDDWESLSSVSRTLDFRVTVRDNSLNTAGCTDEDDMLITVTSAAGPFLVMAPNDNMVTWYENESKTISWDVAGTDLAPVSCDMVDILLSYDGGFTYPEILASNVPNTGTALITVPALMAGPIQTARVMVRCANNVFYDISNNDFSILEETPTYTIEAAPAFQSVCQGDDATFNINSNSIAGFTDEITLSFSGVPAGIMLSPSSQTLAPGENTEVMVTGSAGIVAGTYPITVTATDGNLVRTVTYILVIETAGVAISQSAPADAAIDVSTAPEFTWDAVAGVSSYQFQLALDANFTQLVVDVNLPENSYQSSSSLSLATTYYWRVRTFLPCEGPYGMGRSFTTGSCLGLVNNEPLDISASGAGIAYNSIINTTRTETVESVVVSNMTGTHTWMEDLDVHLISPTGTRVELFSDRCGNSDNFDIGFDDAAVQSVLDAPCVPMGQGFSYRPIDDLADFIGENVNGDWTLEIIDDTNQDGGQLQRWSVEICLAFDPLPVEWLSFSATARDKDIQLSWSTALEINNAGFEIERMANGENDFVTIGRQAAARNAQDINNYHFADSNVLPGVTYFYRIRQLDSDGTSSLSAVKSAMLNRKGKGVTLYPNPVTQRLNILSDSDQSKAIQAYQIFDAQGRLVSQQLSGFDPRQGIDCGTFVNGVYTIRLVGHAATTIANKRFVVNR